MACVKEQRWELRYVNKDGVVKACYPRSKEMKDEQLYIAKERGLRVLSCKKLYPFNTYGNQHNFELINNICHNAMYDMDMGEKPYDEEEYERLSVLKDKAEKYWMLPLPVAWLPWEDWKDAKELSQMAIIHRQNACIEAGRPDLVTYC